VKEEERTGGRKRGLGEERKGSHIKMRPEKKKTGGGSKSTKCEIFVPVFLVTGDVFNGWMLDKIHGDQACY